MMNILIANQCCIFCFGLKRILEETLIGGLNICESYSIKSVISLITSLEISLLITDLYFYRQLQNEFARLNLVKDLRLIITQVDGKSIINNPLKCSTSKIFLDRRATLEDFKNTLTNLCSDQILKSGIEPNLSFNFSTADLSAIFSRREIEVLALLCEGLSNNDIANILFISNRTVEWHKSSMLKKSKFKNILELVINTHKSRFLQNTTGQPIKSNKI